MESQRLAGKTALVTGGGTGIGAGIALALAKDGCRVAISGRRPEPLAEVAAAIVTTGGPPVLSRTCDVGDREDALSLVTWATEMLGRVDILVNSAGINVPRRTMEELDPDDWDRVMRVNATGAYNCIRAVLPQMRARKDGLIINISSVAGVRASLLGGAAYTASKFAMTALGRYVSLEEKDHGIRVTNVYPGEVETPILDTRPIPVSAEHRARILLRYRHQADDAGLRVTAATVKAMRRAAPPSRSAARIHANTRTDQPDRAAASP
jgi:NAD(P)-dependent dehydrogenase (short-subunit alcohol dehydrogenase family)